jgi:hypothetical protein
MHDESGSRDTEKKSTADNSRSGPKLANTNANSRVQNAHTSHGVSVLCPDGVVEAFARDAVVEITAGMSKGLRGVVLGPARSMYLGVPDVEVRMEDSSVRWIRPDYLRRIG